MRLQFLGTGGYHPNERRHTSCLILPELGVILDAGTAFFRVQHRVQTPEVHIFVTHAHLDHVVGLTYFLQPLITGQVKRAVVYARAPYLEGIKQHLFSQPLFPILPTYEFVELAQDQPIPGGGTLTHCPLTHAGGSTGFKLTWPGRTLAYITDTQVEPSYFEFVRGVDVLIHECNFPDRMRDWAVKTEHSHTTAVATLARDAGVGRLYLFHIDPQLPGDDPIDIAAARAIFPATEVAEDLLEIDL